MERKFSNFSKRKNKKWLRVNAKFEDDDDDADVDVDEGSYDASPDHSTPNISSDSERIFSFEEWLFEKKAPMVSGGFFLFCLPDFNMIIYRASFFFLQIVIDFFIFHKKG